MPAADWFAERVNNSWNQSHSMESECVAASEAEVKRESQIEFKKIVVPAIVRVSRHQPAAEIIQ